MVEKIIILTFLGIISCTLLREESDELTFEKMKNSSQKLDLSGYYIRADSVRNQLDFSIYFLYRNGVLMYVGTFGEDEFDEKYLKDETLLSNIRRNRTSWGVYLISNDSIVTEKWHHSGGAKKVTYVRRGTILNDSTFVLNSVARSDGSELLFINELYHFKKFHPKPDSLNDFIK